MDETRSQTVPLKLRHLLVWMLLVSLSLATVNSYRGQSVVPLPTPLLIAFALGAAGVATQLAGLLLAGGCRWSQVKFPVHPGERLWVYDAVALVARSTPLVVILELAGPDAAYMVTSFVAIALAGLYVHGAVQPQPIQWRVAFGASALTHALLAVLFVALDTGAAVGIGLWLVVSHLWHLGSVSAGMTFDTVERRLPWSHWVGGLLPLWNSTVLAAAVAIYLILL